MADETPQEEYNKFKKEMGKQYMDGLISDTEYDKILKAKEAELGLNQPAPADEEEGPECPSCGALIGELDEECGICGIVLEPIISTTEEPDPTTTEKPAATPMPMDELGLEDPELDGVGIVCPGCGAEVSELDTVCTMCGVILETEAKAVEVDIAEIIDEKPMDDEKSCPSCGAFVDAEATECIICDTSLVEAIPSEDAVPEEPIEPAPITDEEEIVCAGCGAVLDEGSSECFICGVVVGEEPAAPAAMPVEELPEIDEPIPEV
ncbi:MAG: zinc ribbon domain-containing protein, partial [Thermoplasmata archaeon]|nr:zinc ribbon domain-containing protein [Thermoplasmata archaeon]